MQSSSDHKQIVKTKRVGFTLVEVVAAMGLLAIMLSSVLVVMDHFVGAVIDMRLRQEAFELARSNMETLLSESKVSDLYDYGESEINPDIQWETTVEPFYEPYKSRMWIRAVCSASFVDSKDQEQNVELEHWITNLTAAQINQILAQQQVESAYMDLLNEGQYSDVQLTTIAYLEEAQLDVDTYKEFLEQQRRQKVEYLDKNGMDGYEAYVEQLREEEDEFLQDLGMNFAAYNEFAENYVPPETETQPEAADPDNPDLQDPEVEPEQEIPTFDWPNIPRELWPLIEQMTGAKAPSQ